MAVIAVDDETKRLVDKAYELLKMANGHTRASIVRASIRMWLKENRQLLEKLRQRQADIEADQDIQTLLASLEAEAGENGNG